MTVLEKASIFKITANNELDPQKKSSLGQFFTPEPICLYMASLFTAISGDVKVLDPGCGSCSLVASFTDEAIRRGFCSSISVDAFDVEAKIVPQIRETLRLCKHAANKSSINFSSTFHLKDFILENCGIGKQAGPIGSFSHVIMNPPYKKIGSNSAYRKALRLVHIEAVNLYAGFVALSIQMLRPRGELVAIIPRSFCNGPYYRSLRDIILRETAICHIHIFESRSDAFSDDKVLQENIIIHLVKGAKQEEVTITSCPTANFQRDVESGIVSSTDMTIRTVSFASVVNPNDKERFFRLVANKRDQAIIDKLNIFTTRLDELNVEVSTGAVVDFRLKEDLRDNLEVGAVPLIYPVHLNGGIRWPKQSKKANAIMISRRSRPWLWGNKGCFVIVRRFSSKEEPRRIVASVYDGTLPGELIGFENKLDVFHKNKTGMKRELALGLYVYLNSTLLDKFYRLFGGHTQVNATDLRNINYPALETLLRIGSQVESANLNQKEIDKLLEKEIYLMTGENNNDPLDANGKLEDALIILKLLGMPRAQQNERSALTLLALIDLKPEGSWKNIRRPILGVTPIMKWIGDVYGKVYAPNTRETIRRQTLHQFVSGALCLYNPDKPERPVNSPHACYQISSEVFKVLTAYGTNNWEKLVSEWLKNRATLISQYKMARKMEMIPLALDKGVEIKLSPGAHSQLIHDIVVEFGPRFAPGSRVLYLGDTGAKEQYFLKEEFEELGVTIDRKGKLPDVVLYWEDRDWLLLIESVTSHGPVDGKRHSELSALFKGVKAGLVYVTAFPDRRTMGKYLRDICWETEVWVAEAPTHMIHFNGDKFLGPHE